MQTDVIVVGGGPAGLAAAIAARRQGLEVMVVDGARPPIDKGCGEGLMPDGVAALASLGICLDPGGGGSFRGIRFVERGAAVEARFPNGVGLGLRRTTLHELLLERARSLGVALHWGVQARGIAADGTVLLDGGTARGRWIVGADGQNSRVRRWAGLDAGRGPAPRYGFRRHWRVDRAPGCVEVHWGEHAQFYLTPVGPRTVCAALISRDPRLRLDSVPTLFPEPWARLALGEPLTPERGALSATRTFRAVARGRVALVGDASGSVDAVTGEGLCLAFQQAISLAGALACGDLDRYSAAHREILRLPRFISSLMLAMAGRTWFRRRALAALAADPTLFPRLLAVHVGALAPHSLGMSAGFSLG